MQIRLTIILKTDTGQIFQFDSRLIFQLDTRLIFQLPANKQTSLVCSKYRQTGKVFSLDKKKDLAEKFLQKSNNYFISSTILGNIHVHLLFLARCSEQNKIFKNLKQNLSR